MRFRRGTRVEVLDRKEISLGSWRCGEIISVNRHSCTVRYYSQNRKNTLAKISSSAIRPCQPHLGNPKKWIPGDVMEVFNDFSWKMGKVINSLGRTSYVVQILGTSEQCRVHLSKTRLRRSWHNGRWIVIGQVYSVSGECEEDGQVRAETQRAGALNKHHVCSKKTNCCPEVIANEAKWPAPIDVSLRIQDSAAGSACSMSHSESYDASSIGSCSITDNRCCASPPEISPPAEDMGGNMNNSESCKRRRCEEWKSYFCPNSGLRLEAEVHSLELLAYRRMLEALHASGALTWDQESLMSNLRVFLNISSEEHLAELRDLLSAKN